VTFSVTWTLPGPPPAEVTSTLDPSLNVVAGFESEGDGEDAGGDDEARWEEVVEDCGEGDPEPQADRARISVPAVITRPITFFMCYSCSIMSSQLALIPPRPFHLEIPITYGTQLDELVTRDIHVPCEGLCV
jgi:hypothetical protein